MGIHGEPGIRREPMVTAAELARKLLEPILTDLDYTNSDVAVLVNGMGGTPLMELYILYHEVEKILHEQDIHIYRSLVGNYVTSLDMTGCSVTLLRLDDELKLLLSTPCDTPALKIL